MLLAPQLRPGSLRFPTSTPLFAAPLSTGGYWTEG